MLSIYEDGTYSAKHPTWHEQDSPWKASQIIRMLNRHNLKPSTVCEIGCGAGEILQQLSTRWGDNVRFVGYEISPQAFGICEGKSKGNLSFFLRDLLEESDAAEATFDIVMAIDVFEHVEDYFGFLRKLRSKGVYKIFHIPLDLSVLSVLRGHMMGSRKAHGHLHYFSKETALAVLEDTGYEVLDCVYTCSGLELPNRGWKMGLLRIPRRLLFSGSRDLAARLLGGFSLLVLAK